MGTTPVKNKFTELRRRAQDLLSEPNDSLSAIAPEDIKKLIHELDTYQIELELQNEDLSQAQKELEQSHRRYSDLYDFAPVGYLTISDKGLIVESNLTAAEMLEVSRASLIGQPFSAFIESEYQDSYYQHRRTLIESGTQQPYELQILRKESSPLAVQLESVVIPEMDGNLGQFRICLTDISKRKALEETLQKSTEWGKTFDAMPDVVTIQDTDMRIVRANKAAHQLVQASYGEMKGKHCYELFCRRQEPCTDCPLCETLQDKKNHFAIIKNETLNKIFQVSSSIISTDTGDVQYLVHVAKDISEQKKLEEELFQAHKMEAIGALAGGIAHDFNNILSIIIGYAQLVQQDVPTENRTGKNITEVLKAGTRAADLVKQILAFGHKSDLTKYPLKPHIFALEALKMMRATLPTSISMESSIDPACGMILADPISIHQIIVNLCTNAMHAMPDNKGTLHVTLQRLELSAAETEGKTLLSPGPFVVLTVRDNGRGMDKTTMERIFDPYFTTKELGRGTGLGLAVVHGAVQNCCGFIEVESSIGKGSIFTVYLPAIEESTVQPTISDRKSRAAASTGREKILMVDDELLLVKINEERLKNKGYQVTCFTDSRKALEKFRSQPDSFDLLITDQTMPEFTGAELAKAVLEIKPSMPIIMCTGYSESLSEKESLAIGIKKYIFKPVNNDELLDAVREELDAK